MILEKIKEKSLIKSKKKRNYNDKINIIKKYLSEISINNKNKKSTNLTSTNGNSTTTHIMKKGSSFYLNNINPKKIFHLYTSNPSSLIKTRAMSTKNLFRKFKSKKLHFANTAKEMEEKFYSRSKEGIYDLEKSYNLSSGMLKSRYKMVNKILFDYNNIRDYNKEVLNNTISKYNRNLEFFENQANVKKNRVLRDALKFERLKNSDNPRKIFRSSSIQKLSESPSSLFATPKYKSPIRMRTSLKKDNLEEKVHDALMEQKYYNYKRLKENAKKYCQQVRNLEQECDLYETIDDELSKLNLQQNIYYNSGNLDRIIKLEGLKDERFVYEDYELNNSFLKKSFKAYSLYCDKAISGVLPSFVKKNHFLSRTIDKYGYLQGKYFGLPV